jgi:hypothetical protein
MFYYWEHENLILHYFIKFDFMSFSRSNEEVTANRVLKKLRSQYIYNVELHS